MTLSAYPGYLKYSIFGFHCQNNYAILLMGSPGCGKTSTGQLLSARLAKPVSDIDDDFLEQYWGMPVAHKVIQCLSVFKTTTKGGAVSWKLAGRHPSHSFTLFCLAHTPPNPSPPWLSGSISTAMGHNILLILCWLVEYILLYIFVL